eukprot:354266-Chlamydomonas_euryale.AAC.10
MQEAPAHRSCCGRRAKWSGALAIRGVAAPCGSPAFWIRPRMPDNTKIHLTDVQAAVTGTAAWTGELGKGVFRRHTRGSLALVVKPSHSSVRDGLHACQRKRDYVQPFPARCRITGNLST